MRVVDLLERNAVWYPDRTAAAIVGGESVTFSTLTDRVRRIAAGLTAEGVDRGDRIALMAHNGLPFFDVYLAAAYLGAAAVPINIQLTDPEIGFILRDAEPAVTIADPDFVARLAKMPAAGRVIDTAGVDYRSLLASDPLTDIGRSTETDVVLIIYTSGTTGRPKGVCLTQRGIAFNGLTMALVQQFGSDDVFLSTTPLYHAASGTRIASMLADGQTHVVLPRFDPGRFFDVVEQRRVSIVVLVPTQLRQILDHPDRAAHDLSSLRLIVYGAAPTAEPLIRRAYETFACGLYQGYGITEAVTNLTALTPEDHRLAMSERPELLGSCGRVVPGVRIEIRDDRGGPSPTGEVGEIWVRSEKVMAGYWRDPQRTSEALVDGWLRTGDLARMDDRGYVHIVGRADDMLISGGVNVYPSEIESVLHRHPGVVDVAVVGRADETWGERPVAFVEVEPGVDTEQLRRTCVDQLAKLKVPDEFVVVDQLPRTVTGKVRKVELRGRLSVEP